MTLRTLAEGLESLYTAFQEDETLKKACVRNLWTVLRPVVSQKKFVKVTEQKWAEALPLGTHRLKAEWVQKRFQNLDENGMPKPVVKKELPQEDVTFHGEPGDEQVLTSWKEMARTGEMTKDALRQMTQEPWLEMEVSCLEMEGLEEAKELLKTPRQRRQELGLDVHLTAQGDSIAAKTRKRNRTNAVRSMARQMSGEVVRVAMQQMYKDGFTPSQAAAKHINPRVGKKKGGKQVKKTMRDKVSEKIVKTMRDKRRKRRQAAGAEGEPEWADKYVGKTFRVDHEYADGGPHFGCRGICVAGRPGEEAQSTLDKLTLIDKSDSVVHTVPLKCCNEMTSNIKTPADLLTLGTAGHIGRIELLGRYGITDVPTSAPLEKMCMTTKLAGNHVQLWLVLLEFSFSSTDFTTYSPDFMESLYECIIEDSPRAAGDSQIVKGLQKSADLYKLHLFPIHSPQSEEHPDGHWTLLALDYSKKATPKVRYYDMEEKEHEICLRRAQRLLNVLKVKTEVLRTNVFREPGADCIFWLLHYAELEVRQHDGQGWGSCHSIQHSSRKRQIRRHLAPAQELLEKARVKWFQDEEREALKLQTVSKFLETKKGRHKELEQQMGSLKRRAAAAAEVVLRKGAGFPDPAIVGSQQQATKEAKQREEAWIQEGVAAIQRKIFEEEEDEADRLGMVLAWKF